MSPDEFLFREVLADIVARPRRWLSGCPHARPADEQAATFWRVVHREQARGVQLPRRWRLEWRRGPGLHFGEVEQMTDGQVVIRINIEAPPDILGDVVRHEVQHAADAADPQLRHLDPVTRELRACHAVRATER